MTKQRDRDEFIGIMAAEGVPIDVTRALLRAGTSLHRIAELQCSSEAADRDRVPCPGDYAPGQCLCRDYGSYDDETRHERATCGNCRRSWCASCDPGPAALCHWCHGRGRSTARWSERHATKHGDVPRINVREAQIQTRIEKVCKAHNLVPVFQGDPRGAVLKVKVPSGKTNDWGQTGICVP